MLSIFNIVFSKSLHVLCESATLHEAQVCFIYLCQKCSSYEIQALISVTF
jgi:hypothetical protein